ncbi:LysR family transcriptional regulator [Cupriavidus basilensis]|uniref:LysR family transcriptional regulator n=1 Tax=Cupriavidus basilensis TaxID=68895 RepID=A0ABT6AQA0_9BURK|nr:LysR family transcriptional regulator [Cupriavidus basilensis]MDF3834801.1 LysR family transcriptional regulator [Cupriavidus basilensis]
MDIRFLQSFVMVVELGSMAEAARHLELSPATIASRIHALEEDLGVALIERSGRVVRPTTAGVNVLERARDLVRASRDLRSIANERAPAGEFRLGLFPSAAPSLLPRALARLYDAYPELGVRVTVGFSPDMIGSVGSGDLDAAIVVEHQIGIPKSCTWQTLMEEPLVVVAHRGVDASKDAHELLRTEPFIKYDRRVWGGRLADRYLRENGIRPHQRLEIDGLMLIASLIKHGLGISLLPDWSPMWEGDTSLVRVSLPGQAPVRRLGFLWSTRGPRASLAQLVLSEAEATFQSSRR